MADVVNDLGPEVVDGIHSLLEHGSGTATVAYVARHAFPRRGGTLTTHFG